MRYLDESPHDIHRRDWRPVHGVDIPYASGSGLSRASANDVAKPPVPGRWTRRVVIATGVWSVLELPFELWISASARDALAMVTAKLLWLALVGFVLAGHRVARIAYGFLCTIGLIAMAFALPAEYRLFPLGFALTSVECVLKATAFVCLVSAGIDGDEK